MRVFEQLFDLGPHGILAITSASGCYGPIPAQSHGRARLVLNGEALDRLECCTRAASLEMLRSNMAELRQYLIQAVGGVQRQLAWSEARFSDQFREMPAGVAVLGDGLVMLTFSALKPHVFRIVDIRLGTVLWEMGADKLLEAHGIAVWGNPDVFAQDPGLQSCGGERAAIAFHPSVGVFEWTGTTLRLLPWSMQRQYAVFTLTHERVLRQPDGNRDEREVLDPATGGSIGAVGPLTTARQWARLVTSAGTNRVAFVHRGGTVDVVEDLAASGYSIRPFPRAGRNDDLDAHLSDCGRYLGVREWTTFRVVDLERRLVAEIDSPVPNMSDDPDEVIYDSDLLAAERCIAMVSWGTLTFHDYASLRWEPVVEPGRKRTGKPKAVTYRKHLGAWAKPALDLVPGNKGRSQLYGLASLPDELVPAHEGEPMMLLAQIDLGEASRLLPGNPWPSDGLLCFFVAIDGEGAAVLDEAFNPMATRVVWFAGEPVPATGEEPYARVRVALRVHRANLPEITSAIVEGAHLDEDNIEAYREYLEKKGFTDASSGHRLGGYPTLLQGNDLEAEAAAMAGDLDDAPRDMAELAMCARWRLLLQLDSDENFMWGTDSGALYFMIRDEDLERRDFSKVVALTQGY